MFGRLEKAGATQKENASQSLFRVVRPENEGMKGSKGSGHL